jgi:hypothetical protein
MLAWKWVTLRCEVVSKELEIDVIGGVNIAQIARLIYTPSSA